MALVLTVAGALLVSFFLLAWVKGGTVSAKIKQRIDGVNQTVVELHARFDGLERTIAETAMTTAPALKLEALEKAIRDLAETIVTVETDSDEDEDGGELQEGGVVESLDGATGVTNPEDQDLLNAIKATKQSTPKKSKKYRTAMRSRLDVSPIQSPTGLENENFDQTTLYKSIDETKTE